MQRIGIVALFTVGCSIAAQAQHVDLTARVNYIVAGRYNIFDERASGADRDFTVDNNYFSGGIVAEKTNAKNIVYRLRAGIIRNIRRDRNVQLIASTGESLVMSGEEKESEFKFAVGIGKYYDFDYERISFIIGVELPVRIGTPFYNDVRHEFLDANGTLTDETKIYFDEPPRHSIGIKIGRASCRERV